MTLSAANLQSGCRETGVLILHGPIRALRWVDYAEALRIAPTKVGMTDWSYKLLAPLAAEA